MVHEIDPLADHRWPEFLGRHPAASVFHSRGWLEALRRTYGYQPFVLTTAEPRSDLRNGMVACRVHSWLTGRRLVSLPFSDHCEPLTGNYADFQELAAALHDQWKHKGWKYTEIRPLELNPAGSAGFNKSKTFWLHRLCLYPNLENLFRRFHRDCVQRKIRRARREALAYEEGRSELLLQQFFRLLVLTRRRQLLFPQSLAWFRNLISCMGERLKIRVAFKDRQPVASILTLSFKDKLVFKYGCSDTRFNNLGGTQLLFWRAIQDAKASGLTEFDMGRSDLDNPGLIEFKDRWGAARSTLTYWRFGSADKSSTGSGPITQAARRFSTVMPTALLTATGRLLYKHLA
jgi:hypothetical protein